jgi:hypothetical protein
VRAAATARPRGGAAAVPGKGRSFSGSYALTFEAIARGRRAPGGSKRGIGHAELLSRSPGLIPRTPRHGKGSRTSRLCKKRFERRGHDARQNVKKMSMPPVSGAVPAYDLVGVAGAVLMGTPPSNGVANEPRYRSRNARHTRTRQGRSETSWHL